MKLHPLVLALGFIPLVGCGGSSEPITVEPTTYSVRAVDGYLRNALVWLDLNGNFQLDQGEPQAKSEEGGIAILDVSNTPNPGNYSVVVKAVVGETVDEDSITESNPDGIATTTPFLLSAPAGQRVITPLSTLVNIKMGNGLTQQQATAEVATDLGIAADALLGDYMAGGQGDIAAKANALVELAVLPESEQQMQEMSQDDSGLDQELAANLMLVQALTEEQRLIKEEDGSVTVAANTDSDDDGVIDGKDAFPEDPSETLDSDKDGKGDNSDAFPDDPTETLDSDRDGMGDNSDAFPDDPTETLDSDKDGKGNNSDAYINDPEKSVLDFTSTQTSTTLFTQQAFQKVTRVQKQQESTISTFNNGDIQTTIEITYTTPDGQLYGKDNLSDLLKADGSFTRINKWSYDFNLDGNTLFIGQSLDIGSRTANGESFLSYIDESDAALEGGDNGGGRVFDNMDLSSRNHPNDLSLVDTIQNKVVTWQQNEASKTIITDYQQYPTVDFDRSNLADLTPDYAFHSSEEVSENGMRTYSDQRDWNADGNINQSIQFTVKANNEYTFSAQRPVWANPTDGIDEEYADFNFASGKADILTSYWYETSETLNDQGVFEYAGKRYVLNQLDEANIKLLNTDNPDGLLFQEYLSTRKPVSDTESNEMVSWTHYPLADYDFTVDSQDTGQAYKVFQKQSNGIWVGYSFAEWGSQLIVDLADKIETARAGGTTLSEIDDTVIAGLSAYNRPINTPSFAYDESGAPRTWYFVSNNPALTDGQYSMRSVTLTDNGIKEGWLVLTSADNFFLAQPIVEQPWDWFNAYQRYWLGIDSINTDSNNFMWNNWMGEFYLNESQAQVRLTELQTAHLFGSWANEYVAFQFNSDMTYRMEQIIDDGEAPDSWAGTESGTFSYNNATGKITVTSISDDQNGTSGLSDYLHNPNNTFMVTSYEVNNHLVFSYTDGDESGEFTLFTTNLGPDTFSTEYLADKTFYSLWFGDGELANAQGQAIDENGNLISNPDNAIALTNVAVVQAVTFNLDGTVTAIGVKNAITMPDSVPYHYLVDTDGVLRIVEEQNEASEGNFICDNSHPDYLKTHFVVSDINGVEQFDNVDLFFFDKQKALDYAQSLSAAIAPCSP